MAETVISGIEFSITADTSNAISSIDQLSRALKRLQGITAKGGIGLASISSELSEFSRSISKMKGVESIEKLSSALKGLSSFSSAMNRLSANPEAISVFGDNMERIASIDYSNLAFAAQAIRDIMRATSSDSGGTSRTVASMESSARSALSLSDALSSVGKAGSVISRIGSFTAPTQGLKAMGRAASGVLSVLGGLVNRFKRLLIMRTFRSLIRSVVQSFKDGINNLYGWSSALGGEFARSMNTAATASQYLKNSLGAMVAPLVNQFVPVLDFVIDKVVDFLNTLNQLFAMLTGASYWTRAIKQAASYGDAASGAIGSVGGAAKEALRYLAPFDEINKFPEDSGSSGGSGGGSGGSGTDYSGMFEIVPLEGFSSGLDNLIQKLKDVGQVFKDAWETSGQKVVDSAKTALNSILSAIGAIGTSFYNVFTGGYGFEWLTSGLDLLSTMLTTVSSIADAFTSAWEEAGRGDEYVQSIFESMTAVQNLANTILSTFNDAWNDNRGETFFSNLISIATNLNNIITNISSGISDAWGEDGEEIWGNVLDTVNDVLTAIDDITAATADWADDVDFANVTTSLENITGAFEGLVSELSGDFAYVWNTYLLPFAKWSIEEGIPKTINMLAEAFRTLTTTIEYLKPVAGLLDKYIIDPLAKLQKQRFEHTVDGLTASFTNLRDLMENGATKENMSGLLGGLLEYGIGSSGNAGLVLLYEHLQPLVKLIRDFVNMDTSSGERNWNDFFVAIANLAISSLNSAITAINQFLNDAFGALGMENPIPEIPVIAKIESFDDEVPSNLKRIKDFIAGLKKTDPSGIKPKDKAISGFTAELYALHDGIETKDKRINDVTASLKYATDGLSAAQKTINTTSRFTAPLDAMSSAQKTINTVSRFSGSTDALRSYQKTINTTSKFTSPIDALSTSQKTFATVGKFSSIQNNLSNQMLTFMSVAKFVKIVDALSAGLRTFSGIMRFTKAVDAIPGANKVINVYVRPVPGWSGSLASYLGIERIMSTITLKMPKISVLWDSYNYYGTRMWYPYGFRTYYARGGIMDGATLFGMGADGTRYIGGEAGAEAILPLENHTEWMDTFADRVIERMSGENSNTTIQLVVDGKVLAETNTNIWRQQARAGQYPLAGIV